MSSYGLYGSISIYYKAGLRVSGCMRTYAYNLTEVYVIEHGLMGMGRGRTE